MTRPDLEPMVAEIFARTPNGCGHRQIRMCLVHEFGVRVSHKSVLKVMRRMGGMPDTQAEPVPEIQLVPGRDGREGGEPAEPRLHGRPAVVKLGTDVTEFRVADGKAYPAPVYDMGSKRSWPGRQPASRHGPAAAPARHARGEAARRRRPDPALRLSRVCC